MDMEKPFVYRRNFAKNQSLKKIKIKRFWWASITKSEGNSQNHQIPIVGFQCVAINIGGCFKNYTSFLVYSQLLLNFSKDDHHFRKTFLLVIHHLAYKKNIPKKIDLEVFLLCR
jgi:hypothetical protein